MTLKQLKRKHTQEESDLLLSALEQSGWVRTMAAKRLRCQLSTLQRMIARHPRVAAAVKKNGFSRGRPRKKDKPQ